jgi:hypothetical protein
MAEQKIETRHPDPSKSGVNISKEKYDQVHDAIVQSLREEGQMTFSELGQSVNAMLEGKFDGAIGWYYTTVKLDLEARGILIRIGKSSPQQIRLVDKQVEDLES